MGDRNGGTPRWIEPRCPAPGSAAWQGSLACTVLIGPAVSARVDLVASVPAGESLPLALAVWLFAGAGIWLFRRWGGPARGSASGPHPELPARAAAGSHRT